MLYLSHDESEANGGHTNTHYSIDNIPMGGGILSMTTVKG